MDKSSLDPRIISYLERILEINKTTNLTRITSLEEALILHIEDSLLGLDEVSSAPLGPLGDLGSGGGFPGVPLALATGRTTTLIDSVKKKMNLVQTVLETMDLQDQITTSSERIETLALSQPQSFSVLTARALTQLPSLLELASPLLPTGGLLICYKGKNVDEELLAARPLESVVGLRLISDRAAVLSDHETERRILTYEKYQDPSITLPRRVGMAQKHPLQ